MGMYGPILSLARLELQVEDEGHPMASSVMPDGTATGRIGDVGTVLDLTRGAAPPEPPAGDRLSLTLLRDNVMIEERRSPFGIMTEEG